MMTFEDLYEGCIFSSGDASVRKCLHLESEWAVILNYSTSHYICDIELCDKNSDMFENKDLSIIEDESERTYFKYMFDNMKVINHDTLKPDV